MIGRRCKSSTPRHLRAGRISYSRERPSPSSVRRCRPRSPSSARGFAIMVAYNRQPSLQDPRPDEGEVMPFVPNEEQIDFLSKLPPQCNFDGAAARLHDSDRDLTLGHRMGAEPALRHHQLTTWQALARSSTTRCCSPARTRRPRLICGPPARLQSPATTSDDLQERQLHRGCAQWPCSGAPAPPMSPELAAKMGVACSPLRARAGDDRLAERGAEDRRMAIVEATGSRAKRAGFYDVASAARGQRPGHSGAACSRTRLRLCCRRRWKREAIAGSTRNTSRQHRRASGTQVFRRRRALRRAAGSTCGGHPGTSNETPLRNRSGRTSSTMCARVPSTPSGVLDRARGAWYAPQLAAAPAAAASASLPPSPHVPVGTTLGHRPLR